MDFNSLLSSRRQYNATRSAGNFAGIVGDGEISTVFSRLSAGGSIGPRCAPQVGDLLNERARIAQELHDTLLQGFLAASMQLHTIVDHLPADCAAMKPRLDDVVQLLDRALEEGRCAVQGLRSPNESLSSLGAAVACVPKESGFPSAAGFRVVVHGRERELRAGLRLEVYCIVREAIINACRHSRAKHIETDIEYRRTELRIAVRDNGCGIDPQELQWGRSGHWGLRGMRERAERIGARLRLLSKVALGTEVELRVPSRIAFEPGGSLG